MANQQLPIECYALIGDCETAALVGNNGSIDWLCWPRFDSEACLASLIGLPEHGYWRIAPLAEDPRITRRYRGATLVLETRFETHEGEVSLIDFMPLRVGEVKASDLVRLVVGRRGCVAMRMDLVVRFDYGRIVPWVCRTEENRLRALAGAHSVILDTPVPHRGEGLTTVAEFSVGAGQRIPFILAYGASHQRHAKAVDPERALKETERSWRDWVGKSHYQGPHAEAVTHSLITIKALTYSPTGGVVAAPTTSLPERIGGERNWDYRYCWLRDATFSLRSLISAGYRREAEAWADWLLRAVAGSVSQVQPLYGVTGDYRLPEQVLDWLPGYKGSVPVRTGNAAYPQLQTDVFGGVMDALYQARRAGLDLHEGGWPLQCQMMRRLEEIWHAPDEGIWEMRSGRKHFVHSKVMSWVAFDRAISTAEAFGLDGPVERWRKLRDEIHAEVCACGFDERRGAFVQHYETQALDGANLLIPLVGFLPPEDRRVRATVDAIERDLTKDGLVLRYNTADTDDGIGGAEGTFLACSFWLVDNLILQGRHDEARWLFERLLGLRNEVGLLSEQYDVDSRRLLGNFPQAFSHFALIDTAFNFTGLDGSARAAMEANTPGQGDRRKAPSATG